MLSLRTCTLLICGGLATASIGSAKPADADRQSMEETLNAIVTAWDRSDAKSIASAYASDGDLIVPDGMVLSGRATIEAFYESAFLRGYGGTKAGAKIIRAHPIGASAYVADGTWSIDGIRHPGAADSREAGIFTAFFVREKGQWRLHALREQSSATSIRKPQ